MRYARDTHRLSDLCIHRASIVREKVKKSRQEIAIECEPFPLFNLSFVLLLQLCCEHIDKAKVLNLRVHYYQLKCCNYMKTTSWSYKCSRVWKFDSNLRRRDEWTEKKSNENLFALKISKSIKLHDFAHSKLAVPFVIFFCDGIDENFQIFSISISFRQIFTRA